MRCDKCDGMVVTRTTPRSEGSIEETYCVMCSKRYWPANQPVHCAFNGECGRMAGLHGYCDEHERQRMSRANAFAKANNCGREG